MIKNHVHIVGIIKMNSRHTQIFLGYFGKITDQVKKKLLVSAGKDTYIFENQNLIFFCPDHETNFQTHCWQSGFAFMEGQVFSKHSGKNQILSIKNIAELYLSQHEKIFEKLDGSFSIILYDSSQQRLFLCRDDYGCKFLYYHVNTEGGIYFSNSLHEVVRKTESPNISSKCLHEFLRFLDISPPYTIFENIFFLAPDDILTAKTNARPRITHKNSSMDTIQGHLKWHATLDTLEKKLKDSIRTRLSGSKSAGVFLSGGIDSSLICALAADINHNIEAITVGFDDKKHDESPTARSIAAHLGIKHHIFTFSLENDYKAFHKFVSATPSPFADPAIIPTYQCFEKIGHQFDLVLDGTGADTLSGIMPARHIHFILNFSRHLPGKLREIIVKILSISAFTNRYTDLFDFLDPAEFLIRWRSWSRQEISQLCNMSADLSHTMFYQIYNANKNKSPYELYSMLMGALPDDRVHQSSAVFGPEVRFPFFDRDVQAYVRSLPITFRYSKNEPKKMYREILKRYVPQHIWDVPKHGFDYPFEKLLLYRNGELVRQYITKEKLERHNLFDVEKVIHYTQKFLQGDFSLKFKIWGLVVFQGWHENYYRKSGIKN